METDRQTERETDRQRESARGVGKDLRLYFTRFFILFVLNRILSPVNTAKTFSSSVKKETNVNEMKKLLFRRILVGGCLLVDACFSFTNQSTPNVLRYSDAQARILVGTS